MIELTKDPWIGFLNLRDNSITSIKDCQMNVLLENLELLPQILEKLIFIEKSLENFQTKRWMNVKELGKYLGYSNDHIYKLRDGEFIEGIHYHKKGKLLFDRIEIDKWVVGDQKNTALPSHKIVNAILDSVRSKQGQSNT